MCLTLTQTLQALRRAVVQVEGRTICYSSSNPDGFERGGHVYGLVRLDGGDAYIAIPPRQPVGTDASRHEDRRHDRLRKWADITKAWSRQCNGSDSGQFIPLGVFDILVHRLRLKSGRAAGPNQGLASTLTRRVDATAMKPEDAVAPSFCRGVLASALSPSSTRISARFSSSSSSRAATLSTSCGGVVRGGKG